MYQIPASGVSNIETQIQPPWSSLFLAPFSIQRNSTRGLLDLHRLIGQLTCAYNRGRFEWGFQVSGLLSGPFCTTLTAVHIHLLPIVDSATFKLNSVQLQNNLVLRCNNSLSTLYLSPLSREQQLCRAVLGPSIEYLWVTGLHNSV